MIDTIYQQLVTLAVGAIFGGFVAYFRATNNARKRARADMLARKEISDQAMFTLIKSQIVAEWRRLTKQNFVYIHDLEAFNALFAQYEGMGGNGSVKLLYDDVRNLRRKAIDIDVRTLKES